MLPFNKCPPFNAISISIWSALEAINILPCLFAITVSFCACVNVLQIPSHIGSLVSPLKAVLLEAL